MRLRFLPPDLTRWRQNRTFLSWQSYSRSLHLVERFRECLLQPERFFDLIGCHVRILSVFQEARALVIANKLNERRHVRLPVRWKSFEVLKDRVYTRFREQRDGIVSVLVEIGIEDALVHEERLLADIEQDPAQVMELQGGKNVGVALQGLFESFPILAEHFLSARLDLCNDRETMTCRCPGKDRTILSLFQFEVSLFRDRHCLRSDRVFFF